MQGTALLILDYQEGVGDLPYAKEAAQNAFAALAAARKARMPVIFSKVAFRFGYTDVSDRNKVFAAYKAKNLLPPEKSKLISLLQPSAGDVVGGKDRFSAFSGNDLKTILRAGGIDHLVMAGVSTSGVILSTFVEAGDMDYQMTILSDACADPKATLHHELMVNLFPRSAEVITTGQWVQNL